MTFVLPHDREKLLEYASQYASLSSIYKKGSKAGEGSKEAKQAAAILNATPAILNPNCNMNSTANGTASGSSAANSNGISANPHTFDGLLGPPKHGGCWPGPGTQAQPMPGSGDRLAFIVKPDMSSRGNGIYLALTLDGIKELAKAEEDAKAARENGLTGQQAALMRLKQKAAAGTHTPSDNSSASGSSADDGSSGADSDDEAAKAEKEAEEEARKLTLVQAYLPRPLLMDGRKFDLRIYVLVTSAFPTVRAYIYRQGLIRFATQPYAPPAASNVRNRKMFLTNYAVNKAGGSPSGAGAADDDERDFGEEEDDNQDDEAVLRAADAAAAAADARDAANNDDDDDGNNSDKADDDGSDSDSSSDSSSDSGSDAEGEAGDKDGAGAVPHLASPDSSSAVGPAAPTTPKRHGGATTGASSSSSSNGLRISAPKGPGAASSGWGKKFKLPPRPKLSETVQAREGCKWSLDALLQCMEEQGIDSEALWTRIKDVITKTVLSARPAMAQKYRSTRPHLKREPPPPPLPKRGLGSANGGLRRARSLSRGAAASSSLSQQQGSGANNSAERAALRMQAKMQQQMLLAQQQNGAVPLQMSSITFGGFGESDFQNQQQQMMQHSAQSVQSQHYYYGQANDPFAFNSATSGAVAATMGSQQQGAGAALALASAGPSPYGSYYQPQQPPPSSSQFPSGFAGPGGFNTSGFYPGQHQMFPYQQYQQQQLQQQPYYSGPGDAAAGTFPYQSPAAAGAGPVIAPRGVGPASSSSFLPTIQQIVAGNANPTGAAGGGGTGMLRSSSAGATNTHGNSRGGMPAPGPPGSSTTDLMSRLLALNTPGNMNATVGAGGGIKGGGFNQQGAGGSFSGRASTNNSTASSVTSSPMHIAAGTGPGVGLVGTAAPLLYNAGKNVLSGGVSGVGGGGGMLPSLSISGIKPATSNPASGFGGLGVSGMSISTAVAANAGGPAAAAAVASKGRKPPLATGPAQATGTMLVPGQAPAPLMAVSRISPAAAVLSGGGSNVPGLSPFPGPLQQPSTGASTGVAASAIMINSSRSMPNTPLRTANAGTTGSMAGPAKSSESFPIPAAVAPTVAVPTSGAPALAGPTRRAGPIAGPVTSAGAPLPSGARPIRPPKDDSAQCISGDVDDGEQGFRCFELMGLDVILDMSHCTCKEKDKHQRLVSRPSKDGRDKNVCRCQPRPVLLEINQSCSLHTDSDLDKVIKADAVRDGFALSAPDEGWLLSRFKETLDLEADAMIPLSMLMGVGGSNNAAAAASEEDAEEDQENKKPKEEDRPAPSLLALYDGAKDVARLSRAKFNDIDDSISFDHLPNIRKQSHDTQRQAEREAETLLKLYPKQALLELKQHLVIQARQKEKEEREKEKEKEKDSAAGDAAKEKDRDKEKEKDPLASPPLVSASSSGSVLVSGTPGSPTKKKKKAATEVDEDGAAAATAAAKAKKKAPLDPTNLQLVPHVPMPWSSIPEAFAKEWSQELWFGATSASAAEGSSGRGSRLRGPASSIAGPADDASSTITDKSGGASTVTNSIAAGTVASGGSVSAPASARTSISVGAASVSAPAPASTAPSSSSSSSSSSGSAAHSGSGSSSNNNSGGIGSNQPPPSAYSINCVPPLSQRAQLILALRRIYEGLHVGGYQQLAPPLNPQLAERYKRIAAYIPPHLRET